MTNLNDNFDKLQSKFNYVDQMPGNIVALDNQQKIVAISNDHLKLCGWKTAEQAYGKTWYDAPCPASEIANQFINEDKK